MADQILVDMLKRSVSEFNQWRADNPDAPIDFQGANLQEADLRRANLRWADLQGAKLEDSTLDPQI